jgi:exopolyphosphatase / guanosine-5'-triphosphate,3'-diphosphate pyrophosphatase
MPDRNHSAVASRIAVVDVGSNSLRLVVYERLGATLLPLLNEKVMCALGRGIAATRRLNPDGVALAFANVQRFVALARALAVDHLAIVATAAVREAEDGAAFAAEIEALCGIPVRIIDGGEEGRLSAAGVLAGIPYADGVVGDLGGGSVELVRVDATTTPAIGAGVSLPLGPLRLAEFGDNRKAVIEQIEAALPAAPVLRECAGRALYLVGGAWRAIARLHIEQTRYPLHIIHQYKIARRPAEAFLELVAAQSRRSLERVTGMSRRRLEVVPLAATILRRLIAAGKPDRLVFSAFGLREGYAYGVLPGGERADPLIAGAMTMARRQSRPGNDGDRLLRWISPVFPRLDEARRRLYRAACWLSDTAWTEHPDYRAELAFLRSLRMPVGAIEHSERAFIALALHARYGGPTDDPVKAAAVPLLDDEAAAEARSLGLALRLGYTLCGGALDLLDQVLLDAESNTLVLELPASGGLFVGEAVQRRLDALGRALGLATRTERRLTPTPVLA